MDAEEGRENKRVNLHIHLLPPEILHEILSRLPITSLIHFKTTSHAGYNLIADPRLPPMFRNQVSDSDPCLILINYYSVFSRRLYFLDSEGCSRGVRKIDPPHHSERYNLVGSCNGEEEEVNMVQVFTVGTTKWRKKGAPPPQVTDEIGPPEALVEGSLHWVTDVRKGGISHILGIISFELADEVFEEIPHPPCQRFVSREYGLSVLNGCLSAAGLVDDTLHFDIWVMKQYRVKESWVKQFSFDPYFLGGRPSFYTVICALKNGGILLQNKDSSLVSYDPVENRFKTLQISGFSYWFQAFPFLPSLFSAKATMNLQLQLSLLNQPFFCKTTTSF
ncbi:hypothetical protein SLA2020_454450 [Shorea laevis]